MAATGAAWYFRELIHEPSPSRPIAGWTPTVRWVAGAGADGHRDGAADTATFSDPFAVALAADGVLYVADAGDSNAIRRVTLAGEVATLAGGVEGFADGVGSSARFNSPSGVVIDGQGTLYIADTGNHAIRRVSPDGSVATIAGTGVAGWRDGPGVEARFNGPIGITLDADGRLLVADSYNDRIRRVGRDGQVTTMSGDGTPGLIDGPSSTARFDTPTGIAVGPGGAIFVADTGNGVVRRIGTDGAVTTIPVVQVTGNLEGLAAPTGLVVTPDGRIDLTDRRGRIVEMSSSGVMRTLAGSVAGFADGPGDAARFRAPSGLALAADGALVVADAGNRMIRRLDLAARLPAVPPVSPRVHPGFDAALFAATPLLWPLDPQGGPHEVAGTLGEARGNPGGEGHERFHAGIDVHGGEGELALAVRDGKVQEPVATAGFGTLNERVTIGAVTYVHIRVGRDRRNQALDPESVAVLSDASGTPVRARVRRGWRVHAGEPVGTLNRFQHVHLSVGPTGEEVNPLTMDLPNFEDDIAPTIAARGVQVLDLSAPPPDPKSRQPVVVRGPVRIVVDAWDRVNGNAPSRRLGVYALGFQILAGDGTPVPGFERPRMTVAFDTLPSDAEAPLVLYAPGSGIPFYGTRRTRFRYVVTTERDGDHVREAPWDPAGLAPGRYIVRVVVADAAGNTAIAGRDMPIVVAPR